MTEAGGLGLQDLAWPGVPTAATVLVPIGSLEQHGPHLPLDTDSHIASAAAQAAAEALADEGMTVLVAPTVAYGASGEHQAFPGTVSIGHSALSQTLRELIRSLSTWAESIVLINGHGGNVPTLRDVVSQMRAEQHQVSWVPCAVERPADAHAGLDETSLMLHLAPGRVRMSDAAAGNITPLEGLLPSLMTVGVVAVSLSGVLGDPTRATPERGQNMFEAMVRQLVTSIAAGATDSRGQLVAAGMHHVD